MKTGYKLLASLSVLIVCAWLMVRGPLPHLHHTFTVTQFAVNTACTATSQTCDVTVSSTGSGHVLAAGTVLNINDGGITAVSGGGTWALCPASGCYQTDNNARTTDLAYCLSSTSGATTITVTRTTTTSATWQAAVWELSFTGSSASLDTFGKRQQSTATTSPAGVTLTLTGSNDAIIQIIRTGGTTPSAISAPYNLHAGSGGAGWAESINTVSGTAPTWTTGSGRAALSAIAFAEITSSTTVPRGHGSIF